MLERGDSVTRETGGSGSIALQANAETALVSG